MSEKYPVITIQCDWNDVLRLPKSKVWISSKVLNKTSIHEEISTNSSNNLVASENYQIVSHASHNLVLRHVPSGLKVVFVAPNTLIKLHVKGVLSTAAAGVLSLSSCEGDKLLVWDNRTGEKQHELIGHGGPVYKCRFFPSGIVAISAGADGSSRVWSAETGINPVTLKGHSMAVMDISIVDKGRNVVTVSRDGSAKLWDVGESRCIDNLLDGRGPINCCTLGISNIEVNVDDEREIATGNKILVAGCENGTLVCSHIGKREQLFVSQLNSPCNACIVMEELVIAGLENGQITHISTKDGTQRELLHESASPVTSLAALTQNLYAVGRQDGTCTVHSLSNEHKAIRLYLTGSDCDAIRDIAFNGKWIFAACRDTNIRKYDFNQITVHFK